MVGSRRTYQQVFGDVNQWLDGLGLEATAPVEAVHVRPWSTVLRVATAGGDLYLKQCAPVQAFEVPLTVALAARWPDRVPEVVGADYEPGTFWEGKQGAAIPPGKEPGWMIPAELRKRWHLTVGRSQEELPPLLAQLGTLDVFMHDSEHSFDCMWFEFNAAWPVLRPGGVLVSDDVNSTEAFARFSVQERRDPVRLARGMALLRK